MKNRCNLILSVLLCVLFLCASVSVATAIDILPNGFTGIYTVEDLYAVRYAPNKNYILMVDLDLTEATAHGGDWDSGYGWEPICADADKPFTGIFDGDNHTIRGLQIDGIQTGYAGLFGYANRGSEICNLILKDVSIRSKSTYTGGIVGFFAGSQISGCLVDGEVTVNLTKSERTSSAYIGGIAAFSTSESEITCCLNRASIKGYLNDSYNPFYPSNSIKMNLEIYAGGISGYSHNSVTSCCNLGSISTSVSATEHDDTFHDDVTASSYTGGICGACNTVENCYNVGTITANASASYRFRSTYYSGHSYAHANGICKGGSIIQCINLGELTATGESKAETYAIGNGTLQYCYYLRGTAATGGSSTDTTSTAVVLTDAQMKQQPVFGYLDFEETWFLDIATGIFHPQLQRNSESGERIHQYIHEHSFNAVVTDPTCDDQGFTTYTCTLCNAVAVDDYTKPLGHVWDAGIVTIEPTCLTDGMCMFTCQNNNAHTHTEPIPALGHDYATVVTEPTCTDKGFTTYTCTRCNDNYCAGEKTALGHAWNTGEVTQEATCTEEGIRTFTCTNDNKHTKVESIPAKGHSYEAVITDPTCEADGFTTYTCSVCGDYYTSDETTATGHSFGAWTQTKTATVYAEGEEQQTCSMCGTKNTRTIPKLPMPKVNIQNFTTSSKTYDYRSSITFKADVDNELPNGQIHWIVDGKDVHTGGTYTAENIKQSFELQAKYYVDGKEIPEAATDVENVNVNTGFFARLKAFFRGLFGLLPKEVQTYFGVEIIDYILSN